MAILHYHDTDSGNNDDDNDEEGSARETRRFQSGEFQERDRDIRAEEQTLFTLRRFNALKMLNFSLCGVLVHLKCH